MPHEQITLRTAEGECRTHVFTPTGEGPWPAVIMYMDAGGVRPAMLNMASRLAATEFVVLLPDLFYRYGPYGPFDPIELFKGDFRTILEPLVATTGVVKAAEDTQALLDHLDTRTDVAGQKLGAVGFCMGAALAISSAAKFGDRFAAVASFHGGNLATDSDISPHLMAPQLKAEVYVAAAENDGSYPEAMASCFEAALAEAKVSFHAETYPAAHGWMMPDFPVYDAEAAARGWAELHKLFQRTLMAR